METEKHCQDRTIKNQKELDLGLFCQVVPSLQTTDSDFDKILNMISGIPSQFLYK